MSILGYISYVHISKFQVPLTLGVIFYYVVFIFVELIVFLCARESLTSENNAKSLPAWN